MKINFSIREHGDFLERSKHAFISENVPNYEFLWKNFIGHDFHGNICISNLGYKDEEKRKTIGMLNYSILENLLNLEKTKNRIIAYEYDPRSIDSYLELRDLVHDYIIKFGVITDREEKLLLIIFSTEQIPQFQSQTKVYKATRNSLQHDFNVTIILDEGLVAIPVISENTDIFDLSWLKKYEDKEFIYLIDYVEKSYLALTGQLNSNLSRVNEELKNRWTNFDFIPRTMSDNSQPLPALSATTETYKRGPLPII